MKIPSVANIAFLLIVCIFGFVLLAPFIIAKDTSSIVISSALIGGTFIVIIYASNHIEKKNKELETKIVELNDKHKELEYLIQRNAKIENMISSLISTFIAPKDIDGTIQETLEKTARLCNAEQSYLFLYENNGNAYLSHQWKNGKDPNQKSIFEKVGFSNFPWIREKLTKKQTIHISRDVKLLENADRERDIIISNGLQSLIIVPVESKGEFIGFISIECDTVTTEHCQKYFHTLKVVSELTSMALNHKSFLKEIALFKNLINRSNDFIFVIDMEKNNIIDVNETACQELGYTRKEFLSMKKQDIHLLFNDNFWENDLQDIFGDRYLEPNKILTRKDKSTLHAEINVTFSTMDHHNYALAVVRDITKRKDIETILAKTKEVMELALEGANLGMWDWNLRTNEVMYDERWAEMIGYNVKDVDKSIESWKHLTHPDDLKIVKETINEHLTGKTPFFEAEFRVKNSKEKWQWILARGKLTEWDKNGEPFRFTGTTMDLNDRKKVEEELRHSNELKDLFTDIMRHDLLNPAGNIKGYSELLMEMEEDPTKVHFIKTMQKSNDKLIDMIETAAKFAKLESMEELDVVRIDILTILKNVIEQFDHRLQEKNMTLELKANSSCSAMLNPIVEEIFANYISNAIKYSPENTKIIVDVEDYNYEWKVNVTDFGEGIKDEAKPLVFDRFKRVNKSGVKGSGLGLAIVKKIAELHGGSTGVEDNPGGKGSVFWVRLKKGQTNFDDAGFNDKINSRVNGKIDVEHDAKIKMKC
ncbi:sensor histidine kinase [Methanolobus psychrotolerans]|uniref:sensor histidine kinase n=1 Tax=Methanolobus psychrotolerans TaxID=1874706 RepID=UPI0013EBCB35|nr:ATP-binding protein [Methanolobus psychrotolerans]